VSLKQKKEKKEKEKTLFIPRQESFHVLLVWATVAQKYHRTIWQRKKK